MSSPTPDLSTLRIDPSARAAGRPLSRLALSAVALGVLAVAAAVFLSLRSRPVPVEVVAVRGEQGTAGALLNASGYVTPRRRATVAAKITGRVADVLAEEGMRVEAGQVLARLDDAEARAAVAAAERERDAASASVADLEVNLANARRELRRAEDLSREGVTSAQALDQAQTLVESLQARLLLSREQARSAEARVAVAREGLASCTVRAPFAGIVVSKDAQRGEMVSPVSAGGGYTRTGIATVVDMTSLEIEVDVNEAHIARVSAGQRVEATLDAYPDWRIPARVRTVIPTADRQKATVKVRISFDGLDPRILPDMGVKVAFLGEPGAARPALRLPRDAVRDEGGQAVVYVLRQGKLERRAVSTGPADGGEVPVLSGLVEGEEVVVRGPAALRDGERAERK